MHTKFALITVLTGIFISLAGSCNQFNKEITFNQHLISRASWQWVLTSEKDSFLCNNIPDSLKKDGMKAKVNFKFTGKMDSLYDVGPVDIPVFYKTLPEISIISVESIIK